MSRLVKAHTTNYYTKSAYQHIDLVLFDFYKS